MPLLLRGQSTGFSVELFQFSTDILVIVGECSVGSTGRGVCGILTGVTLSFCFLKINVRRDLVKRTGPAFVSNVIT